MIRLAWRYLWSSPLTTVLNLLLLTLGLAAVTFVLRASAQVEAGLRRDLAGIDLVVGAKGSPMQIMLAGVFHLDAPTGNIPLAALELLKQQPLVAQAVPLSLGDSFRGYRIAGTTPDYLDLYGGKLAQGAPWTRPMQAVLGAEVARTSGLKVGDRFAGSHGLAEGGGAHDEHLFEVIGVLAESGSVLDRLVLTDIASVWEVHGDHHEAQAEDEPRDITLALVRYRSPLAAVTFPRYVNEATGLQAAAPALEITRLLRLVGVGTDVLRGFAAVLLLSAGLSVFIALWSALRERRADLALLRLLGAPPRRLAGLLLCEALWLAGLATVMGLAAGHGLTALLGWMLEQDRSLPLSGAVWLAQELWVPALALTVAALAALLPVWAAYRTEAAPLLNER